MQLNLLYELWNLHDKDISVCLNSLLNVSLLVGIKIKKSDDTVGLFYID